MRTEEFENGSFYHVYNRGVDKRQIVLDKFDSDRFLQGLKEFNTKELIGSIHENSFRKGITDPRSAKLVDIVAYCLNPNHFHLLLRQRVENGISKFLKSECGGYVHYFNKRYKRTGSLFEGPFKAKFVEEGEDLNYVSVYVGRNNELHQLGHQVAKLVQSSWPEYIENKYGICEKNPILGSFKSLEMYKRYSDESLREMRFSKAVQRELKEIQFEE